MICQHNRYRVYMKAHDQDISSVQYVVSPAFASIQRSALSSLNTSARKEEPAITFNMGKRSAKSTRPKAPKSAKTPKIVRSNLPDTKTLNACKTRTTHNTRDRYKIHKKRDGHAPPKTYPRLNSRYEFRSLPAAIKVV